MGERIVGRVEVIDRVYRLDGWRYGPWLWRFFKRMIDESPRCAWVRRQLMRIGVRWNGEAFEEVPRG